MVRKINKLLSLYVVEGQGPSLMGREWLKEIQLDWHKLNIASTDSVTQAITVEVDQLLLKYNKVFTEGLGVMNNFEATLQLKEGARPKFCRARSVPFVLNETIEKELDRLEAKGILEKVTHSEWAAPVVPVPKAEGQIRLCGDYKVTINPVLEVDQYPLPKPDNIFATLATGKYFSKIDLTHAYQQMKLKEDSRHLHSPRFVSVYPATIWCGLCTIDISKSHGYSATGIAEGHLLPR